MTAPQYVGISHIAIRCRRFRETLDFYTNILGLPLLQTLEPADHSWSMTYVKTRFGQQIELIPDPPQMCAAPPQQGSIQYFYLLTDSCRRMAERLAERGVPICAVSVGTDCLGPNSVAYVQEGPWSDPCLYIKDLEGNGVKLMQPTVQGVLSFKNAQAAPLSPAAGISQISLRCRHYRETLHFYRDILQLPAVLTLPYTSAVLQAYAAAGIPVNCQEGDPWKTWLQVKDFDYIELVNLDYPEDISPDALGFRHYCILLQDIARTAQYLHNQGCELLDGGKRFLQSDPQRLQQELEKVDLCGSLATGVLDPEGNWVELMQYTSVVYLQAILHMLAITVLSAGVSKTKIL